MGSEETGLRCTVQAALRRYDALSEHDPEGAVQFWKTASADFVLFTNPGCETGTPSKTRNEVLIFWRNLVWLASLGSDAYTPRDADITTSYVERLVFTNEAQTEATVRVKQVTEGIREPEAMMLNRWRELTDELLGQEQRSPQTPQKTKCIELWRDTWQKREGSWRWTRRVCLERFPV